MASLSKYPAQAAMPSQDVERAKAFYEEKLGLTVVDKTAEAGYIFEAGGYRFAVFPSRGKASGDHTQMMFDVDNLEATIDELTAKGVKFEQYDMEGFKSDEKGIVDNDGERGAWFYDTEGNLIALGENIGRR